MKSKNKKLKKTSTLTFIKPAETRKLRLYSVEWKDHSVSGNKMSWKSFDEVKVAPVVIHSVGYLVDEDGDAVALAANVGENGHVAEITTILKSCILKKREL